MEGTQPWWESRTVWAAVMTVVGCLLALYGFDLPDEAREASVTLLVIVGPSVAIWGRWAARKALRWK